MGNKDIPDLAFYKSLYKEASLTIGKMQSEIDELKYKNQKLLEKGKEFEQKYLNAQKLTLQEKQELNQTIQSEKLYQSIRQQKNLLKRQVKKLKKDNDYLISQLLKYTDKDYSKYRFTEELPPDL